MILTPKNWRSFQHYKERTPAWIKLHKGLLDDFSFSRLPLASRALAPMLWLLASEYDDGQITASREEIAYRLRLSLDDLESALSPLIDAGFFIASDALAEPEPEASLEREDIDNKKEETDSDAGASRARGGKNPRKVSKPLPDGYPLSASVEARAKELGLSSSEIAREHAKFCNHAKQTDRRCAEWEPAEETWMMGAAERLGKQPASSSSGELNWDVVLELYQRTGHWSKWAGSDPSSPACQAPPALLEKYGLRSSSETIQ